MGWVKIDHELLHDRIVQTLSPDDFKAKFIAATKGQQNEFSRFMRPCDGRVFSSAWRMLRTKIFARDDYTCGYCGARGGSLECDHVVPVSRGGSDHPSNLLTACKPCNRAKRDKIVSIEEWSAERRVAP